MPDSSPGPNASSAPRSHPFAGMMVFCGSLAIVWTVSGFLFPRPEPKKSAPPRSNVARAKEVYPTIIRKRTGVPAIASGLTDFHGQPVMVRCGSCHATRPANPNNRTSADMDLFHQGLTVKHGTIACVACHEPTDGYESLHLADGRKVPYGDSIQLCGQCHGTQLRDYEHGAHGGMTGYWDLKRGPRRRNTCVDCHDPHAPAYPKVLPVKGPHDRFLPDSKETGHE